jgi:hypothetical protein
MPRSSLVLHLFFFSSCLIQSVTVALLPRLPSRSRSALSHLVSFPAYTDLMLIFISKPAELPYTNRRGVNASKSKTRNILQPSTSNVNTLSPYAELPLELIKSRCPSPQPHHQHPPQPWISKFANWLSAYAETQLETHPTFWDDENQLTDLLQRVAPMPGSGGKRKVCPLNLVSPYADLQAWAHPAPGHSLPAGDSEDAYPGRNWR